MGWLGRWRNRVRELEREAYGLYLACRDPRCPWYARVLGVGVVAYALSPIDLIPDFIPVLGLLDDLILVPLGVLLVRRLIPAAVLVDARRQAEETEEQSRPVFRNVAVVIVGIWLLLLGMSIYAALTWL